MSFKGLVPNGVARVARICLIGMIATTPVALVPSQGAAQVAVEVPADALAEALGACTTEAACIEAIQALVEALAAANPDVPVADIIGSVAAAAIAEYNSGGVAPTVASTVLTATASVAASGGNTSLAQSLLAAAATAATGAAVDVRAVAQGSASPA